jgi:hypothetical protein
MLSSGSEVPNATIVSPINPSVTPIALASHIDVSTIIFAPMITKISQMP